MAHFIALLDGHAGAYGISFPDAPGCTAMGETVEETLANARLAITDWIADGTPNARSIEELRIDPEVIEQLSSGSAFVVVPAILDGSRPVKANISLDAGLLSAIDDAAKSVGLTRSGFLVSAARDKIANSY